MKDRLKIIEFVPDRFGKRTIAVDVEELKLARQALQEDEARIRESVGWLIPSRFHQLSSEIDCVRPRENRFIKH